jgi:hypothetical protein
MLPTVALSQAADELAAAKIAAIESVAAEIATKHGISKDAAIDYLKLALKAKNAAEQAKKDGKKVTHLYADMVDKYATTYIMAQVVLTEGTKLYEEMKDEPVGMTIPKERVALIQKWASKAIAVTKMTQNAATAHMTWNMERFSSNPICKREAPEFNIKTCIDLLKATTDEFKSIGTTLEGAVHSIGVIVLAVVPRMTY